MDAVSHLERIDGVLNISYSDSVTVIDFPVLESVSGIIDVLNNDALEEIVFERLESAGSLMIQSNLELTAIDAPALTSVDNQLTVRLTDSLDVEVPCALLAQLQDFTGGFELNEWEECE